MKTKTKDTTSFRECIDDLYNNDLETCIVCPITSNVVENIQYQRVQLPKDQLDKNVKSDEKIDKLFQSLKEINAKLWVIEDDKRKCEKEKDFTEKFIKLSRDVHFLNDDRAKIKLEINNLTGSKIKEIKEYTSY